MWGGAWSRFLPVCVESSEGVRPASSCRGSEVLLVSPPSFPLDLGDMVEIQGFGASLLPWQLEPCSQGSSCLSCSTGSSPYDLPSCCSCIHDR